MVSLAVEEWLRQNEFALIEFRDTRDGRAAFMKDSRLPVWWVIKVAKAEGLEVEKVQRYWPDRPREWVQAALNYYASYPEEIEAQIADQAAMTAEQIQWRFPQMETFVIPANVLGEPPRESE
jgi:uncharacterized protein (DUF433 family)